MRFVTWINITSAFPQCRDVNTSRKNVNHLHSQSSNSNNFQRESMTFTISNLALFSYVGVEFWHLHDCLSETGAMWSPSAVPKIWFLGHYQNCQWLTLWQPQETGCGCRQSSAPASLLSAILRAELYWQEKEWLTGKWCEMGNPALSNAKMDDFQQYSLTRATHFQHLYHSVCPGIFCCALSWKRIILSMYLFWFYLIYTVLG